MSYTYKIIRFLQPFRELMVFLIVFHHTNTEKKIPFVTCKVIPDPVPAPDLSHFPQMNQQTYHQRRERKHH